MTGLRAETLTRADAHGALFGDKVHFAPIRHHSPACAWMVRAMIRAVKPAAVLIEAPYFLEPHIPHILADDTELPVALVMLEPSGNDRRRATYFPFSSHAPELVAMQTARELGIEIRFIDAGTRGVDPAENAAPPSQDEAPFTTSDFIREACRATGMRDGNELWDHLFEHRLGEDDWRSFFADVYAYCLGMRDSSAPAGMERDGTLAREEVMRHFLARFADRPVVVVTGGFHTPGLVSGGAEAAPGSMPGGVEHYLIAYSEDALDTFSGYAAGLRFPRWYRAAWEAAQSGRAGCGQVAEDHLAGFVARMARDGMPVAVPQQVELLTQARGLARFRGRGAVQLHDFLDGVRTALAKTEAGPGEPFTSRMAQYLRGTQMGRAPGAAGVPPLVHDARSMAARHRIPLDSTERRSRKLDIRRRRGHKAASQVFQQLSLLETGAAVLQGGPDFLTGHRVDLLFEEWDIGWSPFVEGRLIDAAHHGATLRQAAAGMLEDRARALEGDARANAVEPWLELLLHALRAGLSENVDRIYGNLMRVLAETSDMPGLARVIARLQGVGFPSDPLHDPDGADLGALAQRAYDRLVFLIPTVAQLPDDALEGTVAALRVALGVLQMDQEGRFAGDRFFRALRDLSRDPEAPPLAGGAALALRAAQDVAHVPDLETALRGSLAGVGLADADRGHVFQAVLLTAPRLLWQETGVLRAAHEAIMALGEDAFLDLLPRMRRALADLNPHETDRLAGELATLFGLSQGALSVQSRFSEEEMLAALALDGDLADLLRRDGLEVPDVGS